MKNLFVVLLFLSFFCSLSAQNNSFSSIGDVHNAVIEKTMLDLKSVLKDGQTVTAAELETLIEKYAFKHLQEAYKDEKGVDWSKAQTFLNDNFKHENVLADNSLTVEIEQLAQTYKLKLSTACFKHISSLQEFLDRLRRGEFGYNEFRNKLGSLRPQANTLPNQFEQDLLNGLISVGISSSEYEEKQFSALSETFAGVLIEGKKKGDPVRADLSGLARGAVTGGISGGMSGGPLGAVAGGLIGASVNAAYSSAFSYFWNKK